jgi:hypothetical protein
MFLCHSYVAFFLFVFGPSKKITAGYETHLTLCYLLCSDADLHASAFHLHSQLPCDQHDLSWACMRQLLTTFRPGRSHTFSDQMPSPDFVLQAYMTQSQSHFEYADMPQLDVAPLASRELGQLTWKVVFIISALDPRHHRRASLASGGLSRSKRAAFAARQ